MTFGQLGGPGFGLISPARRSRMKRQEGDRAGGVNIEDLMLKCRQKVVVGFYQYESYMGPIWGLYCKINGSHMAPTCNLNMGPR